MCEQVNGGPLSIEAMVRASFSFDGSCGIIEAIDQDSIGADTSCVHTTPVERLFHSWDDDNLAWKVDVRNAGTLTGVEALACGQRTLEEILHMVQSKYSSGQRNLNVVKVNNDPECAACTDTDILLEERIRRSVVTYSGSVGLLVIEASKVITPTDCEHRDLQAIIGSALFPIPSTEFWAWNLNLS